VAILVTTCSVVGLPLTARAADPSAESAFVARINELRAS